MDSSDAPALSAPLPHPHGTTATKLEPLQSPTTPMPLPALPTREDVLGRLPAPQLPDLHQDLLALLPDEAIVRFPKAPLDASQPVFIPSHEFLIQHVAPLAASRFVEAPEPTDPVFVYAYLNNLVLQDLADAKSEGHDEQIRSSAQDAQQAVRKMAKVIPKHRRLIVEDPKSMQTDTIDCLALSSSQSAFLAAMSYFRLARTLARKYPDHFARGNIRLLLSGELGDKDLVRPWSMMGLTALFPVHEVREWDKDIVPVLGASAGPAPPEATFTPVLFPFQDVSALDTVTLPFLGVAGPPPLPDGMPSAAGLTDCASRTPATRPGSRTWRKSHTSKAPSMPASPAKSDDVWRPLRVPKRSLDAPWRPGQTVPTPQPSRPRPRLTVETSPKRNARPRLSVDTTGRKQPPRRPAPPVAVAVTQPTPNGPTPITRAALDAALALPPQTSTPPPVPRPARPAPPTRTISAAADIHPALLNFPPPPPPHAVEDTSRFTWWMGDSPGAPNTAPAVNSLSPSPRPPLPIPPVSVTAPSPIDGSGHLTVPGSAAPHPLPKSPHYDPNPLPSSARVLTFDKNVTHEPSPMRPMRIPPRTPPSRPGSTAEMLDANGPPRAEKEWTPRSAQPPQIQHLHEPDVRQAPHSAKPSYSPLPITLSAEPEPPLYRGPATMYGTTSFSEKEQQAAQNKGFAGKLWGMVPSFAAFKDCFPSSTRGGWSKVGSTKDDDTTCGCKFWPSCNVQMPRLPCGARPNRIREINNCGTFDWGRGHEQHVEWRRQAYGQVV